MNKPIRVILLFYVFLLCFACEEGKGKEKKIVTASIEEFKNIEEREH